MRNSFMFSVVTSFSFTRSSSTRASARKNTGAVGTPNDADARVSPDGKDALLSWAVRATRTRVYVGKFDADVNGDVATNVGYSFFPEFWNRGYAAEALSDVAKHFDQHGITEMRALVTAARAGRSGCGEAGFARTRILPENDTIRGVKYDDIEYVRFARQ